MGPVKCYRYWIVIINISKLFQNFTDKQDFLVSFVWACVFSVSISTSKFINSEFFSPLDLGDLLTLRVACLTYCLCLRFNQVLLFNSSSLLFFHIILLISFDFLGTFKAVWNKLLQNVNTAKIIRAGAEGSLSMRARSACAHFSLCA